MSTPVVARAEGVPDTIGALARLDAASFEAPWSSEAMLALVQSVGVEVWLAREDAQVVAAALVRLVAGEGEILRLAVHPEARRRGVGRALLTAVLAECTHRCPEGLFLEVRASNVAARHLYARAGFVEHGRRRDYYQAPREDAVLLSWRPLGSGPPAP